MLEIVLKSILNLESRCKESKSISCSDLTHPLPKSAPGHSSAYLLHELWTFLKLFTG